MNNLFSTDKDTERVILVAVDDGHSEFDVESCLDELEELAKTAGAIVVGRMIQNREAVHKAHYLGKGKMEELKNYIAMVDATGIICDDDLSPNQMKNMADMLDTKIMNRTLLILDIFAQRAQSAEGKLQVELAQLKYNSSHLVGQYKYLSRQGGGIGTRGPGETKLETDRRNIGNRIAELNRELKEIRRHRDVMREKRSTSGLPIVALVGYTNAGKSTLLNTLTGSDILAEDKLFATLDTTTRRKTLDSGMEYLFTDTVGFIQKLPHGLINAFRATLEEASYAHILIHVLDVSNPRREEQMKVVYQTLDELKCGDKPVITVYNKTDKEDVELPLPPDPRAIATVRISAKYGKGIDKLTELLEDWLKSQKKCLEIVIPYDKGNLVSLVHGNCEIIESDHRENGYYFKVFVNEEMENRLKEYTI